MNEEYREQLLAIQIKEIQDKLRSNYEQRSFLLIVFIMVNTSTVVIAVFFI